VANTTNKQPLDLGPIGRAKWLARSSRRPGFASARREPPSEPADEEGSHDAARGVRSQDRRDERYLSLLRKSRKRKFIEKLRQIDHDGRFIQSVKTEDHEPGRVWDVLRRHGAPMTCHVVSTLDELDGQKLNLHETLGAMFDRDEATLLACLQGELAYFEGEDIHWVLQRSPRLGRR
jgi:hypothetical protein